MIRTETHPDEHSAFGRYVAVLRRRGWLIAACVSLAGVLATIYVSSLPPEYEASAKVFLSRDDPASAISGRPDPNFAYGQSDRVTATQAEIAASPAVAQRVRDAGHFRASPQELLRMIEVTPDATADVLLIRAVSDSPGTAIAVAKTFAGEFVSYRTRQNAAPYAQARERVEEQRKAIERASPSLAERLREDENELLRLEALESASTYLTTTPEEAVQTAPRPKRTVAVGLVFGLLVGVGLAFALEALDTRVRSTGDVEQILDSPWLGYIPDLRGSHDASGLVVASEAASPRAESFRSLRTALEIAAADADCRVIMLTSAGDGEGKSTTAGNLALTFAEAGRSVVLVDLDVRLPTQHSRFDREREPGVTDVLAGHVTLEDALTNVASFSLTSAARGDVRLLPAGAQIYGSANVLSSSKLDEAMTRLREMADVVIVDAPPALGVSDSGVISRCVDGVLLIVDLRKVRRRALRHLRRSARLWDTPLLGVAVAGDPEAPVAAAGYYDTMPARDTADALRWLKFAERRGN
jgi:succinoglycan biosynthesis transport protein ExoP